MSYRLITKATVSIGNATFPAEIRAFPSPKRAPQGNLEVDGKPVPFKVTGGKGRGTVSMTYVYFPLDQESAYFLVPQAHAGSLGESIRVSTETKAVAAAPAPTAEQPKSEAKKASRREKAHA